MIERLDWTLKQAGIPIHGVSSGPPIRIDFNGATQAQKDQAQAILDAFDFSQAAEDAWLLQQSRERSKEALNRTRSEIEGLIRALAFVVLDEINTLRSAASLPTRTKQQLKNAITSKLDSGEADS